MRIGITVDLRHSMFSSGHPNTCCAVAKLFQSVGAEVVFLHKQQGADWWDDVGDFKAEAPKRVFIDDFLHDQKPLDLLIEIAFTSFPRERERLATNCVWYCRKSALYQDIESTVYCSRPEGRNLEGISAIWAADLFNGPDDIAYLETLYPSVPVVLLPWIWTPDILETHRKQQKSPVWSQVYSVTSREHKWSLHVCETNQTNTSSCILPLVIARYSQLTAAMPIDSLKIHNSDTIMGSQFFKDNVLAHCSVADLSFNFVGRQRIIDWVHEPKSVILSHNRFVPLRLSNLEAAWVGIPIVHNNTVLRDFGCGLEKLYYFENRVTGAKKALETVFSSIDTVDYSRSTEKLVELRNKIIHRFHPIVHAKAWVEAFEKVKQRAPIAKPTSPSLPAFRVLFTDMWDNFNESHNMFILALKDALKGRAIEGALERKELPPGEKPDLVIFGPFGSKWKSLPSSWPKVHFTGENTPPIMDPSVKLNIGYGLPEMSDDSYLRMPLWMFEIDWFSCDPEKIQNPIPLPLEACLTSCATGATQRKKFCAFVVTNPKNPIRNQAFHTLNKYKPVDSAGRLFNNVGPQIYAGLGGGGGELKKYEFLKDYRFCLVYENESCPGYTTEKLLHAKAAGCVPIYWGDPKVGRDFDEAGFLNANNCKTPEDLVKLVDEVEQDPVKWLRIASVPALTPYKRDLVRRTFSEMVRRFLLIAGLNLQGDKVPRLLGCPDYTMVTGVTRRFWPYLDAWLNTVHSKAIVYLGADVEESLLDAARLQYKSKASFIRFPRSISDGFPDFWEPQHYAWKLWIFDSVANNPALKGQTILYTDCGSIRVRTPTAWLSSATQNGVCLLEDPRQTNDRWCHTIFCEKLQVTPEELQANQCLGGLVAFVAGHPSATKLFSEAYKWAQKRDVIVGEKWSGFRPDGKPFGHRHDQSILSILSLRQKIQRYPLDLVYGDVSRLKTDLMDQAIYVHRGRPSEKHEVEAGICEAFIINLDRRKDRLQSFFEHHPDLKGDVQRQVAVDGKTLQMTPELKELFAPNDFFWKKAVMGCALSHLALWKKLESRSATGDAFLILEDDARLQPEWRAKWRQAAPSLPNDWDCVYLGGILPPNRAGFQTVLETVAPGLARVKPHTLFGQAVPTRYFHFCAYAYVLSQRGARKILESIKERGGYWTSADHMICNRVDRMNLYCIDPLVAGASQDSDPRYANAKFNDFSRVDTFDSDLWNNDERFSAEELLLSPSRDIRHQMSSMAGTRFVSLDICKLSNAGVYESKWLQDLFEPVPFVIESVTSCDPLEGAQNIVVVLMKPKWREQLEWLEKLNASHRAFKIIHLGDETLTDPIHFYTWPQVKGVLRTYSRPDLPELAHIKVIPLGYYRQFKGGRDVPLIRTPELPFRDVSWSFAGTSWHNRVKEMSALMSVEGHDVKWFPQWRDPGQLTDEEYTAQLLNTKFAPCPRGNNVETFRFYEAIDCGCIPVVVEGAQSEQWLGLFKGKLPLLKITSWEQAAALIEHFLKNPEQMEQYRRALLMGWSSYRTDLISEMKEWLEAKL